MNWLGQSSQLDKYISDVKDYLPRRLRLDVSAELRANLEDRIADREEELGRQLNDEESIDLLNEYGHPIRVAASYHGASHGLVSPELFPYYKRAIFAALAVASINLIVFAVLEIMYDITVGNSSWMWRFVNTFMYMLGCITAGFYISERVMERNKFLSRWKPKKSIRQNPDTVSMWGAFFTVAALITWLVILNSVAIDHTSAVLLGTTGNRFHTLLYWMKIQLVLVILLHLVLVFKGEKTRNSWFVHGAIELVLSVGCLICLLINTNTTREIYADVPAPVLTGLDYLIWVLLALSVLTATYYFRKGVKKHKLELSASAATQAPGKVQQQTAQQLHSEPELAVKKRAVKDAPELEPEIENGAVKDAPEIEPEVENGAQQEPAKETETNLAKGSDKKVAIDNTQSPEDVKEVAEIAEIEEVAEIEELDEIEFDTTLDLPFEAEDLPTEKASESDSQLDAEDPDQPAKPDADSRH